MELDGQQRREFQAVYYIEVVAAQKGTRLSLANVAQLVGATSLKPTGCGFDFWSGHMPRFGPQ